MNLETLFEDIESTVLIDNSSRNSQRQKLKSSNRIQIRTTDSSVFSVVAPVVGADFFAGLEEQLGNWVCVSFSKCGQTVFSEVVDSELPKLRFQDVKLEDFIMLNHQPVAVAFKTANGVVEKALVADVQFGHLWLGDQNSSLKAMSLESLEWLQILEFTDSADVAERFGQ